MCLSEWKLGNWDSSIITMVTIAMKWYSFSDPWGERFEYNICSAQEDKNRQNDQTREQKFKYVVQTSKLFVQNRTIEKPS